MYLKSLEMHGFKSFADRTRLEFHPGVTAIVGPNGCGKSNVVDAIRWVLGETSAKTLRGEEMADVIFNGTENRKALGMAEVLLTLADCDTALPAGYHEICVGRRVYRDGKSDYLINRAPCRLRDIQDLFAGTGIGRACYSVMEQGKIDQLLSSKPEDRREVFEEAAGITRFKQQKREALRKLEATAANLLRITDVLAEQQRQMSSLQRQAAKARRFAALDRQLQALETHWSHRHYVALCRERDAATHSLRTTHEEQQENQQALACLQSSLLQGRASLQDLERQIHGSLQAISAAASRVDSARKRVEFNRERGAEWRELIARNETESASLLQSLAREQDQLSAAGEELHRRSSRLQDQETILAEALATLARHRQQRQEREGLLQQTQQRLAGLDSTVSSLRVQIESLSAQLQSQEERRQGLASAQREAEVLLASRLAEKEELDRQLLETGSAADQLTADLTLFEAELTTQEEALRGTTADTIGRGRELASQQARLEMLLQLAAAGEGLGNGTRQVLRGLDDPDRFLPPVRGALVSCLHVEDEFLAAVEAALGPAIQAVLVTGPAAAAAILEALRERKLGHACLVLPEPGNATPHPAPDGFLGWLLDRIEAAEPGKSVLDRLLHGVALAPDLPAALRLRQEHPALPIATLAGDFISANGVISGGFRDPQTGSALRIQKEIRKLRKQTRDLASRVATLEQQAGREAERVQEIRVRVEAQREGLRAARLQSAHLESQRHLAQREREQAAARRQHLLTEHTALDRLRDSGQQQLANLEEGLRQALAEREDLVHGIPALEQALREVLLLEEQTAETVSLLRTELAVARQAAESLRQQLAPLNARLRDLEQTLRQRSSETETHRQRVAAAAAESEQLRREIASAQDQAQSLQEAHEALLQQRESLAREIGKTEAGLAACRQIESRLTQQAAGIEVRMTQFELRLDNLASQISQRYQVELREFSPDLPALLDAIEEQREAGRRRSREDPFPESPGGGAAPPLLPGAEPDWRYVEELIPELRRKLDSLGAVNLDAIAEFAELEDRCRLIRTQHEDLVKSREELLKILARINRTTREMFSETFRQIAANFRAMFTELFGKGSHAGLVLLDEQDPLECGIDIIAKPPGKTLQSINLLSGGERSMTAVALLFAIYLVKPSPFCVLDELDAALDEANIERFCRLVGRFCDQSQFIIVTHSKRTMHRADVMFGVSMEERGVSKTLSVQLAPAEEGALIS